jgi:hypothetical protein
MPTTAGRPLHANDWAPASDPSIPTPFASEAHAVNWVDWAGSETLGVSPLAAMRGQPPPLSWWMRRQTHIPTPPQPFPLWLQSRQYSRGAAAFAPKFGTIPVSPIGAGIYSPYKLPVIAGPGARYQAAAIWFDVQSIPTSLRMNPTVPIETINALIATSHVGPSYLTTG